MTRASPIVVIADDLSGAAELAGIAFGRGLSAEVQRKFDSGSKADVIAVDTDTRSLSAEDAAKRVASVVRQAMPLRPLFFKKVDSVLRGNPRSEIEAILKVADLSRALLIPANPSRGRAVEHGRYLIDGVPLDETVMVSEVEHSRRSADVRALLGEGEFPLHVGHVVSTLPSGGIVVPDVTSAEQLVGYASMADGRTLLAGAADFFGAVLPMSDGPVATPRIEEPALLVCGSRISWQTRSNDCLVAGIPIVTMDTDPSLPTEFGVLLLGIGERVSSVPAQELLRRLANSAAVCMQAVSVKTLLAEGGATASAIAERLGWTRFEVVAMAPAGVGVLRPLASQAPLLLIKPGSYAWPPEIWGALCRCRT